MTDLMRVEIDGDLFMCIMQEDEKAGTVKLWLSDAHKPVSYTHLRAPRDGLLSRMPSSA